MKVGIIGLRPRQRTDIRGRDFNGHDIHFFDKKSYSQEHIAAFTRDMDQIILLPANAPKRVGDWVLKSKLHLINGSVSSIVRYLEGLKPDNPPSATSTQTEQPAVVEDIPASSHEETPMVKAKQPEKLGQTIPKGRVSQYVWSPDEAIVYPDEYGQHRYDLLDAAVPGDVLRMARPEGVDYQVWRTRLTSMRYNREKTRGQILEAHYYEKYVDLFVLDPDPSVVLKPKVPPVASQQEVSEVKAPGESDSAVLARIPESAPEGASRTHYTGAEEEFWCKAYLTLLARGDGVLSAAETADKATLEYRQRFSI